MRLLRFEMIFCFPTIRTAKLIRKEQNEVPIHSHRWLARSTGWIPLIWSFCIQFAERKLEFDSFCSLDRSILRPKCDRNPEILIFPETREKMLFSGVSFVPIALLNPEFFASEEQKEQRQELFILAVVISRFRDQNVIGEENFWFSQKLDKKCFPTPYRLSRSSFWVLRSLNRQNTLSV